MISRWSAMVLLTIRRAGVAAVVAGTVVADVSLKIKFWSAVG
jgi:uncharacterized protein YjeT (DUF2065 family)